MDFDMMRKAAAANPEAIPQPYSKIYGMAGFDGLVAIFDAFGGTAVYIPSLRSVLSACIEKEAIKELQTGRLPVERVARMYGYTGRHFRKILTRQSHSRCG